MLEERDGILYFVTFKERFCFPRNSPLLFLFESHRAMFKLGGKKLFVLCLLVKNVSAANSADRCNFKESEKVAQDLNRIGGDISSD